MILPERIKMRATMYGDGANGYAIQIHENKEHGIVCTAVCERRGAAWVQTWTAEALPDRSFATYRDLRAAMATEGDQQ